MVLDYLEGWNSQVGLYSTAARPQQPSSPSLSLVSTCHPQQLLFCLKAKRKDKASVLTGTLCRLGRGTLACVRGRLELVVRSPPPGPPRPPPGQVVVRHRYLLRHRGSSRHHNSLLIFLGNTPVLVTLQSPAEEGKAYQVNIIWADKRLYKLQCFMT